jgi:hypothetical protein
MRLAHPSRIWFLAALAALVASFGWNVFHAEEDPNDTFVQDRIESVLYLYLDAPGGTSLDSNASPAAIGVLLERYSWEIWRQPSTGIEQYQNAQVTPESGAMVTLTRSPEVGSLADSTLITGSDGRAWTTFAPEGSSGAVSVQASMGESNASLTFDLTTTYTSGWEEQWSFSHTEATLTASLGSAASTYDVPSGESRELSLSVYYETWDVEVSNFGNSRTVNLTGAPAVGASVSWSVEMGDGYVAGGGQTDASGVCPATLTVGSSGGNVRAEVSFSTGSATSATLAFSPSSSSPPTSNWYQIGSSITPSITGLSPIGGTSLALGQSIQISGTLQGDVWDLWSNGTEEESRYSYTTPLAWTSLLAEIAQGGGSLDSSSPTTQWDGSFSTGYTMGYSPSRIDLRSASTNEVLASVDFALSEEPPATGGPAPGSSTVLYSDGGYAIQNLTVDGPTYDLLPGDSRTIGGTLYWVNWDVVSDGNGTIENRITSSSPVSWSSLSAVVDYGDGTLSSTDLTSGSLGEFSTTMTMGAAESKVTFSVPSAASTAASMVFTPPQAVGNQGVKISDESLISVAFEADPNASNTTLLPGQSVPLRARVLSTSWEVWQIEGGTPVLRNQQTRPAIGAIVTFSQVSGPGSLSSWQAETDADGIASVDFILGEGVSILRADASFSTATAGAEVRVSPEIWVYDSSYDELELALSLHGGTETPNAIGATLQVRRTEIWRNLATDNTEARQQLSSPAENASIVFSALDGGIATFGANPSFTDYTGNSIVEYRSNGAVNVAATATFTGKTITATMQAPQGWGLAGTDGGGTTDGGGNVDGGNPENGTDGGGNTLTTGGGENTTPPTPSQPIPTLHLRGRKHETNDPESETHDGGTTVPPNLVEIFRAKFSRPVGGQGDDPQEPDKDVTGRRETWDAVRDEHVHANPPWEIVEGPTFEFVEETELVGGNSSTMYHDYVVRGRTAPESEIGDLKLIKNANAIRQLVEAGNFIPDAEVNGAFSASFAENPWDHTIRETAAGRSEIQSPEPTARASYLGGSVPSVVWTEYWLEAEDDVPSNGPSAKHIIHFMARRKKAGEETKHWFGSATLGISNASGSDSRRVSTTTPVVTWSEPDASPPTNWVVAESSGVLRFQPEVMRDAVNEILPVEFYSDLNNDGQLTSTDSGLVGKPYASGASEEEKDKGTEFMFANDNLSNGAWDKEDTTTEGKPADADDDDAEELRINPGITEGEVWLDHPAIAGLTFYEDKKCTQPINLSPSQRRAVSTSNPFPKKVFVRAESVRFPDANNPQVEGDLVLKIKVGVQEIDATKIKLTVVKNFGAQKYFLAARDYIFENNTRLFVKDSKYSASTFRVCTICEELATLSPIETYHDDPTPDPERKGPRGIKQAITTHSNMTIITNGNMVYFSGGESKWDSLGLLLIGAETSMTDKCQGGIVTREHARLNPASTEAGTVLGPGEGVLAQNQAKFVAQQLDGSFLFEKGHLPKTLPAAAMGGLSTFYDNPDRAGADRQFVGYWPRNDNGTAKGCIFTATHTSGNTNVTNLVDDARNSEVPAFEGTRLKMFMLDSGDAAVTLAHSNPDGDLKIADFQQANILRMQASYQAGVPYFTNTYLAFKTLKPRQ